MFKLRTLAHPVRLSGLLMVGSETQHLLEVAEGFVHVVLIVQTHASHKQGVSVHAITLEDVTGIGRVNFMVIGISCMNLMRFGIRSLNLMIIGIGMVNLMITWLEKGV